MRSLVGSHDRLGPFPSMEDLVYAASAVGNVLMQMGSQGRRSAEVDGNKWQFFQLGMGQTLGPLGFSYGFSTFSWDEQFISELFCCWRTRFLIRDQSWLSQTWEGGAHTDRPLAARCVEFP